MNISLKRWRAACIFAVVVCLPIKWISLAQEKSIKPEEKSIEPEWKVWVWKGLNLSKPHPAQVSDELNYGALKMTLGGAESGRLAIATTHLIPDHKNSDSKSSQYPDKISVIDLSAKTDNGFLSADYAAKIEAPEIYRGGSFPYNVDEPQFSPNGRYLLLKFRADYSTYFPFVLDTQKGTYRGLTSVDDRGIFTPGATSAAEWSPDNYHLAYFKPQQDENGEGIDELYLNDKSQTIYVQDWRYASRQVAAKAQGLVAPLAWLNGHTLLYGSLPQEQKTPFGLFDVTPLSNKKLPRPNLYTYNSEKKSTELLIKDGYRPSPSPNGSLIAFFGSRDPKRPHPLKFESESPSWLWRYFCSGASLCVAKTDGTERIAFQSYSGLYPRIQWLPDNNRFVTIECVNDGATWEATVNLWNVQTQNFKKLTVLKVVNDEKPTSNEVYPTIACPFSPVGSSPDGKKVYITSTSYQHTNDVIVGYQPNIVTLQSIDVHTGQVSVIATVQNGAGIDWTPTSLSP